MQNLTINEFSKNPMSFISYIKNEPIAVVCDDKPIFYCVDEQEYLAFLAFKNNDIPIKKPKKSIKEFAGILKNKTDVQLTIDELNDAINDSRVNSAIQGLF